MHSNLIPKYKRKNWSVKRQNPSFIDDQKELGALMELDLSEIPHDQSNRHLTSKHNRHVRWLSDVKDLPNLKLDSQPKVIELEIDYERGTATLVEEDKEEQINTDKVFGLGSTGSIKVKSIASLFSPTSSIIQSTTNAKSALKKNRKKQFKLNQIGGFEQQ